MNWNESFSNQSENSMIAHMCLHMHVGGAGGAQGNRTFLEQSLAFRLRTSWGCSFGGDKTSEVFGANNWSQIIGKINSTYFWKGVQVNLKLAECGREQSNAKAWY